MGGRVHVHLMRKPVDGLRGKIQWAAPLHGKIGGLQAKSSGLVDSEGGLRWAVPGPWSRRFQISVIGLCARSVHMTAYRDAHQKS
jgi:hypothetical protein